MRVTASSQESPKPQQLQMVLRSDVLAHPPALGTPPGYRLRGFRVGEESLHTRLMRAAGFEWTDQMRESAVAKCLSGGFIVVEHEETRLLVATAMAHCNPSPHFPEGGELGWVAADPDHRGRGLGLAVCAAAVRRFAHAGYVQVYLRTDDHRLPAINIYLKLGFVPFLHAPDMAERWHSVSRLLKVDYETLCAVAETSWRE